jgi:hypothetical protein
MPDENKPIEIVEPVNPIKSVDNRQPDGKFGPGNNANPKGRPPKGWALSDLIEDGMDEEEPKTKKQFKELIIKRLIVECVNGNIMAMRELFNRIEGMPRMKMEVDSKVDMKIPELVAVLDKMLEGDDLPDEPKKDDKPEENKDNQTNS